ncbi:hypothetical protein POM88_050043 [Heracleum sosnowskyi]|uniref:Uncharacterized protein n=1 Tax=Heracleum sosnowskyi TaxID=360622 RepID=A0AAD8GZA2_9APIA|nr:hypothetical protein POM88_050043 [Heracleum sosnowskyi]
MVFEQNNFNQDPGTYGCENNTLNPQISNSPQQILMVSTILNSHPQLTTNEGSSSSKSQTPHIHEEKAKVAKRRKTNSEEDDKLLLELVKTYGPKWNFIAEKMSSLNEGKQFKGNKLWDRYNYHLRPGIQKEAWSEAEDLKLMEAHEKLGNKWTQISKVLPGRSAGNIKNRWNSTKRKCLNAIKESNNPKPKPSPLFENYVKSILTHKDHEGPIPIESNEVVGRDGNELCLANGSNGLTSVSNPIELPNENSGMASLGESQGSPFVDPNDQLILELDHYIHVLENNGQIVIEHEPAIGREGNQENFDGSNAFSISFDPNNLPGEKETTIQRSNGMCSSYDQNEFFDGSDSDWVSFEELIYTSDDDLGL